MYNKLVRIYICVCVCVSVCVCVCVFCFLSVLFDDIYYQYQTQAVVAALYDMTNLVVNCVTK